MPDNDLKAIMAFIEKDSRPLEKGEFIAFWKTLTDREKDEYKNAELD